jgi:3-hydroxybutyryl-CoA dehydrogenase
MDMALRKIISTTDYNNLSNCDIIIEAATENQSVKEKIFTSIDKACKLDAILATNTSSISITAIAEVTSRPEKVIGMHFMNPVPIMKLVEIVRGKKTDDDTTNKILEISEKMGKRPIECNDSPGFVTNRILMPMINEAVYCLMEGVGTKEAIDEIMQLGMAHPMGPLTLADLIGLDVCRDILQVLYQDFGDNKYEPCPLLDKMVQKGHLGRKTGQGFYQY